MMLGRLGLLFAIAALCGCAGYRVGPTNGVAAGSKTVRVNLFHNETDEPRLVEPFATALRRTLQQDGTFKLETRSDGDVVVDGTILRYERSALSFDPRDILTARDFQVTVIARVTAIDRASGVSLLDREVRGRTTIRSGADLASAERQAVPLIAEDLARNVTAALVDGTW